MKFLFCAVFFLLSHQSFGRQIIEAADDGDCVIDAFNDDEWANQKIIARTFNDNGIGVSVLDSTCQNIKGVGKCSTNCYFDVNINGGFIIKTNEKLKNMDGDVQKQDSPKDITTTFELQCNNGKTRTMKFQTSIVDVNEHAPEFEKKTYEYNVPMPMPPKVNLMTFGTAVAARDIDFSNSDITFEAKHESGVVCSKRFEKDAKFPYILQLEFNKVTRWSEDKDIVITATDTGSPKTSSTDITLKFVIDKKNSEKYVEFTKPSFTYKYDLNKQTVSPENEEVTLTSEDSAKCTFEDSADIFEEPTVTKKIVKVALKKSGIPAAKLVNPTLTVKLSCSPSDSLDYKKYADIVILIPEGTIAFDQSTYTSKYIIDGKTKRGSLTSDVMTMKGADIDKFIVEETDKYFEVVCIDKSKNQWKLSLKTQLDSKLMAGKSSLSVIIGVQDSTKRTVNKASVIVWLPNGEKGVDFIEPIINADYTFDANGKGSLKLNTDIYINSDDVIPANEPVLKGDYQSYFKATYEAKDKTFKISKSKDLPKDVLKKGVVTLTLEVGVTLDDSLRSIDTAVVVHLKNDGSSDGGSDDCDSDDTVWIVVVIVLALALVIYVGATLFYYFKKIRNGRNDHDFPPAEEKVETHFQKRISHNNKYKDVATRRPTGFIRYNPDLDKDSENSSDKDEEVEKNTLANKNLGSPEDSLNKISEGEKNVEFSPSPNESETTVLADELKKAVQERQKRLI